MKPQFNYFAFILVSACLLINFPQIYSQESKRVIVKSLTSIEYRKNSLITNDTVVMQINDRSGDTEIDIPYSKIEKLELGEAWIEDMQGNVIRKLQKNEIKDSNYSEDNSTLYSDTHVKSFELKHNKYPYRIVYTVNKKRTKFTNLYWIDFSDDTTPVEYKKVQLTVFEGLPVKYNQKNISEPSIKKGEGNTIYTWELNYLGENSEINESSLRSTNPELVVLPLRFNYGVDGSWDTWQTFGDWIYRLNSGKDKLPASEKEKIDILLKGLVIDKQKAIVLYHYLQDYNRYVNVNIKIGGLQTYPAEYVCNNHFGDCKALSNYMVSMLRYAGIEAFYTLVDADKEIPNIDKNFPSQTFNHAIVTIPFKNDTSFLECTSNHLPFGYIHSFIQGRPVFMVEGEGKSRFINVPRQKASDVLCTREINMDIASSESSSSKIDLQSVQRGAHFEMLNEATESGDKDLIQKYVRKTVMDGSFVFSNCKLTKSDRDSSSIFLHAGLKYDYALKAYGNNILLPSFPIYFPRYESPSLRKSDLQLNTPEYYKDKISYRINGKTISKVPDNLSIESEFGNYSVKYIKGKDTLILEKSILIKEGSYKKEDYANFCKFINEINNNENKNLYIETL